MVTVIHRGEVDGLPVRIEGHGEDESAATADALKAFKAANVTAKVNQVEKAYEAYVIANQADLAHTPLGRLAYVNYAERLLELHELVGIEEANKLMGLGI